MMLTELAGRVEISIAYLSRIERERENPPPDRLISALAGALSLPLDELFAAARRLPPDLLSRIDNVIAVYRLHAAGRRL
jgi:HTH-type transcriptional regulator, competence development regulator